MGISFFSEKNYKYREQVLTHILFIALFFFIVIADLNNSFQNASYVFYLQLAFCTVYIFSFKNLSFIGLLIKKNKQSSALLIAWFVSLLFSFFYSYPIDEKYHLSIARLLQSYMHVFFFLTCWHLFLTRAVNFKIIFYVIVLTSLIVIFAYVVKGYLNPFMSSSEWLADLPFNSHIRHAGYQVVVSICLFLVLFMDENSSKVEWLVKVFFLSLLFAFLFWLGGRGAIISVYVTVVFYCGILIYRGNKVFSFIMAVVWASIAGLLLSEYFVLYSWSGLIGEVIRSNNAESINELSSGRLIIWLNSWETYKEHVFLGLGPQGFLNIPNDFNIVQPHNALLQFLIEWGLVGTLIFVALLLKGFYFGFKKNVLKINGALEIYSLGAGGVIVALSFHALFDGTYYHPQPSLYLAFAFALWVNSRGGVKHHR